MIRFVILILLLGLMTCAKNEGDTPGSKPNVFFGLEDFVQQELKELEGLTKIEKKATYDEKEEVQILEAFDLEKELSLFSDLNINNPNWAGKYKVDTLFDSDNQIQKISHFAIDDELRVRSLVIEFEGGQVSQLLIEKSNDSVIANSVQSLAYIPGTGYSIRNKQAVILSPEHELSVEVKFLE